ncbi:MAG TPA: beta-propeller fold lactonase family protein [Sedimentisphaerales bacterium]|nr:beta-propeller fold lactonase family protein [Sedimentisphaerales bacterium]
MKERYINRATMWMSISIVLTSFTYVTYAAEEYLSPTALVADNQGETIYIAEATAKQIAVFDTKTAKVIATISVPAEPTGLALTGDGTILYVTCGGQKGCISVIDTRNAKLLRTLPAGHSPIAPVLSPDGSFLYVCNRFDNNISVISTEEGRQIKKIPALREPVAAGITPDGNWLYVGNMLPYGSAGADSIACNISVINAKTMAFEIDIVLPNGSTGLHGIVVSPDGRFVFASHILARYTVPTTQLERGWINTNAVSIIDARRKRLIETVLLDDVDYGAANPWGLACTSDTKYLCVTHAGTHELSVIDIAAMLEKINSYNKRIGRQPQSFAGGSYTAYGSGNEAPSNIPNELSFLYGIRQRIKLPGKAPRALTIIGSNAYVAEYFTDSIAIVDISTDSRPRATSIALGPKTDMTVRRKGQMLFNNAELCFQGWQSCASCHPSDARVDALNWDLLNDGLGNPKNTKSLLLAHETPPAMITGIRENAELAVRAGIRHIQFAVRPEEEAAAIDEYLKSLKPVPSPHLVDGKLSESAERGQKIFDKAGCASCHTGSLHTDLKTHKVGTGKDLDKDRLFDTPTLVEIWRTAPYLYDGRAATIEDVLTTYNPGDKHGVTSDLTEAEIKDLAEFILSQ